MFTLTLTSNLNAESLPPVPEGSKKIGFSGNPAQKRGSEIGFDFGLQAAKADFQQGLQSDPKRHNALQKPDQYYRYEFGMRSAFTQAFRSGFLAGYQKSYRRFAQAEETVAPTPPEGPFEDVNVAKGAPVLWNHAFALLPRDMRIAVVSYPRVAKNLEPISESVPTIAGMTAPTPNSQVPANLHHSDAL